MAASWILVPCLVTLRGEFNRVAPNRDKGADGSVGDTTHAGSSSDHNPDETGNTPTEDPDRINEVHAIDVDSSGPWPDGKGGEAGGWFDRQILAIAAREKVEYESATLVGRLQNIIWRGRIISRSWGWSEWRAYTGPSRHFDHAHLSARYLASTESDTRPWGVAEEDDMPTAEEIAKAVWAHQLVDGYDPTVKKSAGAYQRFSPSKADVRAVGAQVAALAAKDVVDEPALAAALAPILAAALPPDQPVTGEQLQAAILGALRELAAGSPA